MKHIDKQEPASFTAFLRREHPADWEAVSRAIGRDLRCYILSGLLSEGGEVLPSEQNHQCAYTEIGLEPEDCHIDHFRKQSLFPALRLEWNNLFVSTNEDAFGAKHKDKVIRSVVDNNLLIDPARENPADYFRYTFTGEVLPVAVPGSHEYRKAEATIAAFNLNDRALVNRRATAIRAMVAYHTQFDLPEILAAIREFDQFLSVLYAELAQE